MVSAVQLRPNESLWREQREREVTRVGDANPALGPQQQPAGQPAAAPAAAPKATPAVVQAWNGVSQYTTTSGVAGAPFTQGALLPAQATGAAQPAASSAPFTGSGATGRVAQGNLPLLDQGILLGQKGDLSGKLHGLGRSLDAGALTLERGGQQFERTMRSTGQDVRKSWGPVAGPVAGTVLDGTGVAGRTAADLGASTMRSGADLAHSTADGVERVARRYDNPVGSLDGYLNGLSAAQRGQQVRTLLSQPINTAHPERYKGQLPTRADVIKDAARKHNLDPAVLSGFLLAEQRDQSAAEDEKDIAAATKAGANTSIGLGQVTVGTASKDNAALLQDTVDEATRRKLSHADVARLLQSDDHNIYAAARYLRGVANAGARTNPQNLPDTMRTWPGLDLKKLSGSRWGRNEVEAMGSEYTSKPWDDKLSDGWGWFVGEAVSDVRRNWQF